jgi:amino acid transporter
LYCLSFSFVHCIVCLFLLAIVLSVFYFCPLYCLSFSFVYCIVCLFLFKKKTDNTMAKSKRQTIQWTKVKGRQYNGQ